MDGATYDLLVRWGNLAAMFSVALLCLTATAAIILGAVRLWRDCDDDWPDDDGDEGDDEGDKDNDPMPGPGGRQREAVGAV